MSKKTSFVLLALLIIALLSVVAAYVYAQAPGGQGFPGGPGGQMGGMGAMMGMGMFGGGTTMEAENGNLYVLTGTTLQLYDTNLKVLAQVDLAQALGQQQQGRMMGRATFTVDAEGVYVAVGGKLLKYAASDLSPIGYVDLPVQQFQMPQGFQPGGQGGQGGQGFGGQY